MLGPRGPVEVVEGFGFRVWALGMLWGLGVRVSGLGFRG